jgi:hypothetical protein
VLANAPLSPPSQTCKNGRTSFFCSSSTGSAITEEILLDQGLSVPTGHSWMLFLQSTLAG